MRGLRCVVIGLGRVGFSLEGDYGRAKPCTHASCYETHAKTQLIGGYDIDPEAVQQFQSKFPNCHAQSGSLEEFLNHTKPEIVSISTSSDAHLELIKMLRKWDASEDCIRGILLEKPVGMNLSEGLEIYRIEQEWGIQVLVCHDRRFYPMYQRIKSLTSQKSLGKLRALRGVINASSYVPGRRNSKHKSFGGVLLHDGTHLIDLMIYYAGVPSHCSALSFAHSGSASEDTTMAQLIFQEEVLGSLFVGGRRKYFHFELELEWERAKLWVSHNLIHFRQRKKGSYYLEEEIPLEYESCNPYMARLENLLAVIEGKEQNQSSLLDGVMALKVIDAIYSSSKNQGTIQSVESGNSNLPRNLMLASQRSV